MLIKFIVLLKKIAFFDCRLIVVYALEDDMGWEIYIRKNLELIECKIEMICPDGFENIKENISKLLDPNCEDW